MSGSTGGTRWMHGRLIVGTVFMGVIGGAAFARHPANARCDETDVERINVVEKNGTVRMTLSNADRSPGWVTRGKSCPGRPKPAGMIFDNDEGDEDGGLIFGGRTDSADRYSAFGHLSFDRYAGDQRAAFGSHTWHANELSVATRAI